MKVYQEFDLGMSAKLMTIPGMKTVEEYNEQYRNTEQENAKLYPATYHEILEPITWETLGNNHQAADVTIRLHVVTFYLKNQKTTIHSVSQDVFEAINGWKMTDSDGNQLSTEWMRSSSTFVKRFGNLKVIEIEFKGRLFDCSIMPDLTNTTFQFQIQ